MSDASEDVPASEKPSGPPELIADPGWTALPIHELMGFGPAFVSGDPDGQRLRVRYFMRETDQAIVGKAWFGPGTQGPPGHAHGGSIAALLDEAMGMVAWYCGHAVVAARLMINFRQMLPLQTTARLEAWIDRVDGRKVYTKSRLIDDQGHNEEYSHGEGLFLVIDPGRILSEAERRASDAQ